MQLIIDDFGAYVKKKQNRFEVLQNKKKEEFSADKVTQIVLLKKGTISGSAIALAIENNIDIVYLDKFGQPYARVYPCRMGGTTLTRRKQAEFVHMDSAKKFMIDLVFAKISSQFYLLKSLSRTRDHIFRQELAGFKQFLKFDLPKKSEIRNTLLGHEGLAGAAYFQALSKIVPFTKRQRHASDSFNILLNYGYGILYSEIERACILAGIDPYLGILHTDRYGKPSFVLDFIEQFRQAIVDRAVITLFSQKQISATDFDTQGSTILSTQGKKKIAESVLLRLATQIRYGRKKLTYRQIIHEKTREFVRHLINEEKFQPFCYGKD